MTLGATIARARIALSVSVLLSIYVDPTTGGLFGIGTYMLITLVCHFSYGLAAYFLVNRGFATRRLLEVTAGLDILFAAALAFFTEGPTSPAFAMFLFAIIATGCWADFRSRVIVTSISVVLYLGVIARSGIAITNPYLMRAAYLGIAGYLIDFFGRERDKFEARIHRLEAESERQTIARSLHDGFMQALAGISLRLDTCRDMLKSNQPIDALEEIREIQVGVSNEYDEVRSYVRALSKAGRDMATDSGAHSDTEFRVQTAFAARGRLAEHIIQIILEGVRNTQQHAKARFAEIKVQQLEGVIRIAIDDDGVGFVNLAPPPWTIASRVTEFGGRLAVKPGNPGGVHLEIELPAS